MKHENIRKASG